MARKTWTLHQIKNMRQSRHWSQEKLAETSGLSTRTIQRIEQGHKVDITSAELLAAAFDTGVNELIGTEPTVSLMNPKRLDTEVFKISVIAAIVLFICMFIMALYPVEGGHEWLELAVSTVLSIFVLNVIAQRTFGYEATKRFNEKIFWQGPESFKSLSVKTQTRIMIGVTLVIGLFPLFFPELSRSFIAWL